jgi:hypothetical protein
MRALVEEIELAARGAADPEGLRTPLPPREATYLVMGSYEEVGGKKEPWVRVRVSLARAASSTPVASMDDSVPVSGLPGLSRGVASRIVKTLLGKELPPERPGATEAAFTRHFHRALKLSCGVMDADPYCGLGLPGPYISRRLRCFISYTDEPSYGAVLGRIANDLECALYFKPDDIRAKVALALAYSNRWHCEPERTRELLKDIERADPEGRFGRAARRIRAINPVMRRPGHRRSHFLEGAPECVDAWERAFGDTPEELRGQYELGYLVEAGDWAASRLKDYERAYRITREYLQYVADLPKLEMAEEVLNMRTAMRCLGASARELGRSEEARRFALGLAAKTTGHRAVKFYIGIARSALADGVCDEALTASRRVVELCEGEDHPWYVNSRSVREMREACGPHRGRQGDGKVPRRKLREARRMAKGSGCLREALREREPSR